MSFRDAVRTLANQIEERRQHVVTEEATKQALILPFVALLGFDVWNPAEVIPEYRAGWAKQTEKIDYALQIARKVAIFVEAKGPNETLTNHDPQLAKYFNSTPDVKFAVITNGIQYRFFTDLQERNLLDKKPFFEFDFSDFTDADVAVLERFRKEVFNAESLVGFAEDLVFLSALKGQFMTLLREPSDDLVRFAVGAAGLVDGRITQKVVDRFRPLVTQSISASILAIVGQSFQSAFAPTADIAIPEPATEAVVSGEEAELTQSRIVTTEEELRFFEVVLHAVQEHVPDPAKLRHQDTERYFSILYAKTTGWFARLIVQKGDRKMIALRLPIDKVLQVAPDNHRIDEAPSWMGTCRIAFEDVSELVRYQDVFIAAVQDVV